MPAQRKKKNINLLPAEGIENTTMGRILKWALGSFRIIVIFVELVVIIGFLSRFWLDVQNNDLIDEIDQKSALISSKLSFENEFKLTQQRLKIFTDITQKSNSSSPYLATIVNNLPTGTRLLRYQKTGDTIQIKASALLETAITPYISGLSQSKDLVDVSLETLETPQDSPIIEFTISAKVQNSNNL